MVRGQTAPVSCATWASPALQMRPGDAPLHQTSPDIGTRKPSLTWGVPPRRFRIVEVGMCAVPHHAPEIVCIGYAPRSAHLQTRSHSTTHLTHKLLMMSCCSSVFCLSVALSPCLCLSPSLVVCASLSAQSLSVCLCLSPCPLPLSLPPYLR
jgi:hypothetical protein